MLEVFNRTAIIENPNQGITPQFIQNEISIARDSLIQTWNRDGKVPRSYEPEFDRACYTALGKFRNTAPDAYLEVKGQLDGHTRLNLETTVGERLNAALSIWEYDISEDGIYTQGTNERAIETFKRGREFKRQHGNEVDFAREDAEVVGFYKIDKEIVDSVTTNPLTGRSEIGIEEGTMWISFSHRGDVEHGSSYPHNFYDIHAVKVRDGIKYLESRRYASALDLGESYLKTLRFHDYPDNFSPTPEYFLSHPTRIQGIKELPDADSIHKYLHKNVDKSLDVEQIRYVIERIEPAIQEYIDGLSNNPQDSENQERLRGVLNSADATANLISERLKEDLSFTDMVPLSNYELRRYQAIEVEPVSAGCGFSGDYGGESVFGLEKTGQFSVADYGKDKYGERTFNCPSCKKENIRPFNQLLKNCLHCKSDKVAC